MYHFETVKRSFHRMRVNKLFSLKLKWLVTCKCHFKMKFLRNWFFSDFKKALAYILHTVKVIQLQVAGTYIRIIQKMAQNNSNIFSLQIRFNSGGTISPARSPALSRRYQNSPGLNPGLTPGLVGEHRKSKPNSTSPRKSAPPGQFKF